MKRLLRQIALESLFLLLAPMLVLLGWIAGECWNAHGIDVDLESSRLDGLLRQPSAQPKLWSHAGYPSQYAVSFREGFQSAIRSQTSPFRGLSNRLICRNLYYAAGYYDGRDACELQVTRLSLKYGEERALRALRWRYCSWFDQLHIQSTLLLSTLGSLAAALGILFTIKAINGFSRNDFLEPNPIVPTDETAPQYVGCANRR